jgi:hypothetical protein
VLTIAAQPVYPGVGATNTTGADIVLGPSPGAINVTGVTKAGTTGDTVTVAYTPISGVAATVTLTEGVDFVCAAAASDAACVCNFKAAVDGNATLGPLTVTAATDATCSDEKLFIGVEPGAAIDLTLTPSDGTNFVRVAGTKGSVIVPNGTVARPGLMLAGTGAGSPHGLHYSSASKMGVTVGGANAAMFSSSGLFESSGSIVVGGFVSIPSTSYFGFAAATKLYYGGTDGNLKLTNTAGTRGIILDTATTDGTLALTDESGGNLKLTTSSITVTGINIGTSGIYSYGNLVLNTATSSETAATTNAALYTGAQTNVGNYASGKTSVYTGATTTDGDTGDVEIYTGAAGAGAADAGDILLVTNGAPGVGTTGLQILGSTGTVNLALLAQGDAPATCSVGNVFFDTAGATMELCYCQAANTWKCAAMAAGPAD